MTPILVDERRLAAGLDAALVTLTAQGAYEPLAPAALLERLTGVRVVSDAERRAIIRRIAATRDDLGIAAHVWSSPSFATRVATALDDAAGAPFEALAQHYRTLLAFANVLDIRDALHRALAGERRPIEVAALRIDTALLDGGGDRAFAWRRLCAAAGIALEPVQLGPVLPPVIDLRLVEAVAAVLRYAAGESDTDARTALRSVISGVPADEACALLTASADRSLLALIDSAKVGLGPAGRAQSAAFARGLRAVTRAYSAPDAAALTVLAALGSAFTLDHDPTVAAIVTVARDFDRARTLGPHWDARALIAEFAAEFNGAGRPGSMPFASAPAAALVAESPQPVAVRPMHFSASSLNAYAECARKWYFRYVCSAVEDRGSSASFYGTAFHAALEEFHARYTRIGDLDASEAAAHLDSCIVVAFERYRGRFVAPVEYELERRRARRTARRYLRWLIERGGNAAFEVVGCEVPIELELDGHAFVGSIDRVDRDERTGGVTVIDYKTGTIAGSASEYRDDVAAFTEFQLPLYYWARTAAGDRVTRLALIPLKETWLDVAPIELEIGAASTPPARFNRSPRGTISIGELERARTKMTEYAALLASSTLAAYAATTDPAACTYCSHRDGCRERPAAVGERYSR